MTDTQKYQCGCGKSYTSYPAYSTHKRLKHHNQSIRGTTLPRQYMPKRGRPSFSVPNQPAASSTNFSALTTIELALLKLQQKYLSVLTEPQIDGDVSILDIYSQCDKLITCRTGEELRNQMKNFNSVVVNHCNDLVGCSVSKFLLQLTLFLLENVSTSSVKLQWEQNEGRIHKIDVFLFNKYFVQKGQKEKVIEYARSIGKPIGFLLDLTASLSEYLCKVGLLDSMLAVKS